MAVGMAFGKPLDEVAEVFEGKKKCYLLLLKLYV